MIAVEDYEEQVAYLARLCKSANPTTREQATERLTFLTQLIAADLEKVGPKGYIHGWIKVGPGFTGEHVHHPEHGRGIVTRVGSRTTGVQFENGHYGAFEHTQRAPEHGSAHFAERVPARKPAAPKPPARQEPAGTPAGSFAQIRDRHAEATTKPPTMDDHLGRAHAALTEGRHADAVNHLTAAANAAPDKASRDRITAARNELGARLMGKPPKAPGRAAKPKTPKTPKLSPEDTVARLRAAKSGDEVQQIIAGHTKPELKAALDHAGVPHRKSGDKAHLRDQLTRWAEGQRPKPEVASRRAPSAPRPGAAGTDLHQIRRDAGIETPLLGSPDAANRAAHMLQSGASHKDVAAFLRDAAAAEERNQLEMRGEDTPEINQSRTRQRYLGRLADAVERAGPGSKSSPAAQAKPALPRAMQHQASAPRMSAEPLQPNTWGVMPTEGQIHFHPDGEIGRTIRDLGPDAHLQVQGHALGNVLAHIATDTVMERSSAQEQVDRLRQVRDELPEGSAARRHLDHTIEALHAPHTPAPELPAATPEPLRQLAADLHQVPLVRRDPSREQAALARIAADFAAGRTGGLRLIGEVRRLTDHRHESAEGKFDIDRAVRTAVSALEGMHRADRTSLRPPVSRSSTGFAAAQAKPVSIDIGRHSGLTPLTGRDALDAAPVDARHGSRNGAPLTATARKALDEYLGDGQRINDQIRRGALTTRTKTTVRQVDKVMAESPLRSDVEVWRGIGTGRPIFGDAMNKDLTGFDWTEKAFVSTTADRRVAEEFAGMLPAKEPVVVMRVVAPKGTAAVALSHFGDGAAMGDQAELLLDRDLPFRVVADHGVVGHPRIPAGVRMLDVTVAEKRPHTAAHSGAALGLPDHAPAKKTAKAATRLVGTLNDLTFEANTETPTEPRERA